MPAGPEPFRGGDGGAPPARDTAAGPRRPPALERALCAGRRSPSLVSIAGGATLRVTGPGGAPAVVCVNGGQRGEVAGTWSASLEWLVGRLAPRFPELAFGEVRYRVKSWRRLDLVHRGRAGGDRGDARAPRAARRLLDGRRGRGRRRRRARRRDRARACTVAPRPPAPRPLRGNRLAVLHGSLDRYLPGIPGVHPASSRAGFERARALGVEGDYRLLRGGRARRRAARAVGRAGAASPGGRLGAPGRVRARALRLSGGLSERRRGGRLLGAGGAHVPDEPELLQRADHPPRDVELEAAQPVARRGGERVVVVVPPLAEDEQRDEPVVARLVARAGSRASRTCGRAS